MLKTKHLIKPVALACTTGLLLTACATHDNDYDYSYSSSQRSSIDEASGAQYGWQSGTQTRSQQQQYGTSQQNSEQSYSSHQGEVQSGTELVIPLHEERLNVGKRTVDAGTVTIRKIVTTEQVNQPIELRKETLVIDREGGSTARYDGSPAQSQQRAQSEFNQSEAAGSQSGSGNAFQEQVYTIQLREEQPVVEKNVVQTGQVVARKNAQMQQQSVQREIRREDVQIDRGANAQNVQIRGNFDTAGSIREPSGAQRPSDQDESVEQPSSTYQSETEIETERQYDRSQERRDKYEDRKTLDDINQGSNTRGGAEDLQRFDEKAARP